MAQYRVSWEIDIEAGTPEKAAKQALAIQRDPESTATVFNVRMTGRCPSCKQFAVHRENCRIRIRDAVRGVSDIVRVDLSHHTTS